MSTSQAVVSEDAPQYELLDPDVQLMLQVRDGDAEAFEKLVARYQTRLVTIMTHLVHRRDQAEDLAQEVFLRVYRARKNYLAGAKFSTWLFTIANNVASNFLRDNSRRREISLGREERSDGSSTPVEQNLAASTGAIPARRLDKKERADVVRLAVNSLSERQRMAVVLSKFEQMSYAEIAQTMDLSVAAVKSLLSRARSNLRVLLEPYIEHGELPVTSSRPLTARADDAPLFRDDAQRRSP